MAFEELYLREVPEHDDLIAFHCDFVLEGKALEDEVLTVEENGDLIIEGYAAIFEGDDRQGENFAPGAFERGMKAFLEGRAPLCYHHNKSKVLGKVLDLEQDDRGLKIRARVDGEIATHPELKTYYGQIKKGTIDGLSIGGFFKRGLVDGKRRIIDMDMTEISTTATPVHSKPSFSVLAGKALGSDVPEIEPLPEGDIRQADVDSLSWMIEELNSTIKRINESFDKRGS
jgi:HK97 family phage prohead protease